MECRRVLFRSRFRRQPSNGDSSHSMGIDSRTISSPKAVKTGKSPEIRGTAKIGTAFAMQSASARGDARSQRERQKMDSETTNLFRRRDTLDRKSTRLNSSH